MENEETEKEQLDEALKIVGDKLRKQSKECSEFKKMTTTDTPRTHLFGTPNDSVAPEELLKRNTTTDTPRTDAVQFQPRPISPTIENEMLRALSRQLERELNELWSRFDKQMEAEAEVERLKEIKMNQASLIAAVNYCLSEFPSDRSSVYLAPIMENLFSK